MNQGVIPGPLGLAGWHEFNRVKWGIEPLSVRCSPPGAELPAMAAVLFLDRRGRICLPPTNPYLPVQFCPTPTQSAVRLGRQWLEAGAALAAEMRRRGLAGDVKLPPAVTDLRPWQWAGFKAEVRYTSQIDFPYDPDQGDAALRRNIRSARRRGYVCARTGQMGDVIACLSDTEARGRFSHHLSVSDLELARRLLGDEHLSAYVCYGPGGEPASAQVVLSGPGDRALYWLAGTRDAHLPYGATQLLTEYLLADLAAIGVPGLDYVGANRPGVAAAKAKWGGRLTPFYSLQPYDLRQLARWFRAWYRFALGADVP